MAACGPRDIYNALLKAGFSTNQAIGAMANGIAESGLNPETRVVDSNGYHSDGIWQFNEKSYPNAAALITGNCAADITAQVGLLKASVSGQALAGSSAAEVAGNFAASFERCATCQPGGSSYAQRVANAATVSGWVSSGKWPTSTAGLSGSAQASSAAANGPDCAFGLPSVNFHIASTPEICLIKKATLRHAAGIALMGAGGMVGMLGVVLLAAFAFRASGAARVAANVAGTVTPVGRAAKAAGAPARAYRQARRPPPPEPQKASRKTRSAKPATPGTSAAKTKPAKPATSGASGSGGRQLTAEQRRELAARANQISTRVEPAGR